MRLTNKELDIIKKEVISIFSESKIYLFGSRLDDSKKGGDIDLYIIPYNNEDAFRKKLRLKTTLEDKLLKPFDILLSKDKSSLIEQEALKGIRIL